MWFTQYVTVWSWKLGSALLVVKREKLEGSAVVWKENGSRVSDMGRRRQSLSSGRRGEGGFSDGQNHN